MLALVSFTSTIYPSLIGTWPAFLFFLSKHIDMYTNRHTCACIHSSSECMRNGTDIPVRCAMRAHTTGGVMGTSGGAHPMHRQTFPGEHQKNHQGVFKRPAAANTNTLTKLHTHTPLGCRGKGHIRWTKGTKSISLHSVILQHFRLTLQAQGLAFFSTRVPYTYPHTCFSVRVSDPIGYRQNRELWGASCETLWVCQGQSVWPLTSSYMTPRV